MLVAMSEAVIGFAIVNARGKLALFDGRVPVYWRRNVAITECTRRNIQTRTGKAFAVAKVVIGDAGVTIIHAAKQKY